MLDDGSESWCPTDSRPCIWLTDNATVTTTYTLPNGVNLRFEIDYELDERYISTDWTRIYYNCNGIQGLLFEVSTSQSNANVDTPYLGRNYPHYLPNVLCDNVPSISITIQQNVEDTSFGKYFNFEKACMYADTRSPSTSLSQTPTHVPTKSTNKPTKITNHPAGSPSMIPSTFPSELPTNNPTSITDEMTIIRTELPSQIPSQIPSQTPSQTPLHVSPSQSPSIPNIPMNESSNNSKLSEFIPWMITGIVAVCFMVTCSGLICFCVYARKQNQPKIETIPNVSNTDAGITNNNSNHQPHTSDTLSAVAKIALPLSPKMNQDKMIICDTNNIEIIEESKSIELIYDDFEITNNNTNGNDNTSGEHSPTISASTQIAKNEGIVSIKNFKTSQNN